MELIDKADLVVRVEKLQSEIAKEKKLHEDNSMWYNGINHGFNLAKDILDTLEVKDIPSWKRATEDILIGCLVWDEQRHFHLYSDRVAKGELYISIADILRLPGSPRKE